MPLNNLNLFHESTSVAPRGMHIYNFLRKTMNDKKQLSYINVEKNWFYFVYFFFAFWISNYIYLIRYLFIWTIRLSANVSFLMIIKFNYCIYKTWFSVKIFLIFLRFYVYNYLSIFFMCKNYVFYSTIICLFF